ncbi:MAG: class I adenylate-forming enzyme family protein, partial [Anaerolineales bacterium]
MPSRPWLKRYDPGVPQHLDYPPVPVFYFLDEAARRCPDRPCILFKEDTITYQEVAERTDQIASALRTTGIRKGERVGICMPNCPEFVLAYFAILKAGAVVVATNPLYTPPEIIHQANDAGLETVFCTGSLYERIKAAQPKTNICRVIVSGDGNVQPGDMNFKDLLTTK